MRRWMSSGLFSVLAAAALAGGACKRTETNQQPPSAAKQVEQAQNESKEAYDRAKEAQEKAIDQQKEATKAQDTVTEKRHELSEAEAKAEKESAESQAAQEQARREGETAQQQAQAAQERAAQQQAQQAQEGATQARTTQPPSQTRSATTHDAWGNAAKTDTSSSAPGSFEANAASGTRSLSRGDIESFANNEILLNRSGVDTLRVKIDPATTKVFKDGAPASFTELQGKKASVTYRMENGQAIAERIDITD